MASDVSALKTVSQRNKYNFLYLLNAQAKFYIKIVTSFPLLCNAISPSATVVIY